MLQEYKLNLPVIGEEQKKFIDSLLEALSGRISDDEIQKILLVDEKKANFITDVRKLVSDVGVVLFPHEKGIVRSKVSRLVEKYLGPDQGKEFVDFVSDIMFSFGRISGLFEDDKVEEIMINGVGKPVFIAHRDKGICRTNILINTQEEMDWLVSRLIRSARITSQRKLIDSSLQDGSRISIVLPPITRSPSITIRKFTSEPFTILDLIRNNTLSLDMAAFLWLAVEGFGIKPANILITGGASSGKTTTLNVLAGFIPRGSRVITIEDTPELNPMHRENWVSMYTYYDFKKKQEITMYDLIKASLRMRPDRVIVGEVRGKEAEQMFVAMDVGCSGSMGTLHANSVKETVTRLTTPPMNVPKSMIPLIDLVIVQQRMKIPGKGVVRRVVDISEIGFIDRINFRKLYSWNPNDEFSSPEIPPAYLDDLARITGLEKARIMSNIENRKRIIKETLESGLKRYDAVYSSLERRLSLSYDSIFK